MRGEGSYRIGSGIQDLIARRASATILRVNPEAVRRLMADLRAGRVSVETAVRRLRALPFVAARHGIVDTHRAIRCGFPEVILCQGKSPRAVAALARTALAAGQDVLATRATPEVYRQVRRAIPRAVYHAEARIVTARATPPPPAREGVVIVAAGAADRAVAEEARVTAAFLGEAPRAFYDVGVAGLHRLLAHLETLQAARVVVAVAGMEGALPSVVGGLVACPVVAVPTSVGYGAHFRGIAPLLSMMNACAANVVVVNIDNGFGAGYVAALINGRAPRGRRRGA